MALRNTISNINSSSLLSEQELKQQKMNLRSHFKEVRKQFAASSYCNSAKLNIDKQLIHFLSQQGKGIWAAYKAFKNEYSNEQAVQASAHIQWVYPRVNGNQLEFYLASQDSDFEISGLGILEPKADSTKKIAIEQITGFLVPGLAFDTLGNRLGYGGGFYDRTLEIHAKAFKVGLAYSCQLSDQELLSSSKDQKMDYIISEDAVIACTKEI